MCDCISVGLRKKSSNMGESVHTFAHISPIKTMDPATEPAAHHAADATKSEVHAPEVTASGKPKKRFVGKARKQQQAQGSAGPTIEDSAVAIREGT